MNRQRIAQELVKLARELVAEPQWKKDRHTWWLEDGEYRIAVRPSWESYSRKISGYQIFVYKKGLEVNSLRGEDVLPLRRAKKEAERVMAKL